MDFSFSDEQRAIAEMADGLFRDYCTDDRLRAWELSGEPYMGELWQTCIETGLHALAIPEANGGSGLNMTDLLCVLQAQGASLAQVPLWQHQLSAAALAQWGDQAHAGLVAQAAEGSVLFSLSLAGLAAGRGIGLQITEVAGQLTLSGAVGAVPLASQADRLLVVAECIEGPRLVLLDPCGEGIERVEGVANHSLAVADLHCRDVRLTPEQVLPAAALGWLEQRAIAATAALQLGVSEEQIRRTVAYVSERRQFDRAIGSFQAVQMSMADSYIVLEALRSSLYQLCYRLEQNLGSDSEALSTRYLACEAGHQIGHKTQHVHGGIGVDLTYPIHRYLYWSRDLGQSLGGPAATLDRLGQWLANNDTLGWKYDLEENQGIR
ncbi:acyl-CoA dehydrogenase [Stutzerimonas degradans]|nr:acyl-CoA dehydrogenase [Stutzerimonas degradans]